MSNNKKQIVKNESASSEIKTNNFLFGNRNYMVLIIGLVVMAIGYLLMTGGAQPPNQFDTKEIYGFVRITISSLLVTAGLIVVLFSIFAKHKQG